MKKLNKTTRDFGFFLLVITALFIIALMVVTNSGLETVTKTRIDDCNSRIETLKADWDYAESHKASEEEITQIKSKIRNYQDRVVMLQNRETYYNAAMGFLVICLVAVAALQSMKTSSFKTRGLFEKTPQTYNYYKFLTAPICAVFLLLAIGVTYRYIFWWTLKETIILALAVFAAVVAFILYRSLPYWLAKLNTKIGNTNITKSDVVFLVPAVLIMVLVLLLVVFGRVENGAKISIRLASVSIQPGEFIKVFMAILFAMAYGKTWRAITAFAVGVITMAAMVFLPDLGTAFVIFAMIVIMLFLLLDNKKTFSLMEHKKLLILILIIVICAFFVLLSIKDYAKERFYNVGTALTNEKQRQQADILKALVFGGLGGLGLEHSSHIINIFAIENDMAIAGLTSIFGYGMLIIVLLCYALLVIIPIRKHSVYREFYFVSAQISTIIVAQVLLNALGSVDVLPFTGIVAPFISDGGSALLAFCIMMGIVLATLHPKIKKLEARRNGPRV